MGNCIGGARSKGSDDSPNSSPSYAHASKVPGRSNHPFVYASSMMQEYHDEGNQKSLPTPRSEGGVLPSPYLKAFTFNDLKNATRQFSPENQIGEGGFGDVYEGWIDEKSLGAARPGSGMIVAVKKLRPEGLQGHREWLCEINYLGQLHHPNLVKLIGYCVDGDNRLLVYEYMPKGSLESHLFCTNTKTLPWATRIKVAIGAAQGLTFLHDSRQQVIYRDLKSSNILLDSEFNAKLSDFGLAKAGPTGDHTHVSTRVVGTEGYAAPEYIATGHLSTKCDVYSFGVVLLELLSGRRAVDKTKHGAEQSLVNWAKHYLSDRRKLFRIMDTRLRGQYPQRAAYTAALLAHKCIGEAKMRPQMSEVLDTLQQLPAMRHSNSSTPRRRSTSMSTLPSPVVKSPDTRNHHHHSADPKSVSGYVSDTYGESPMGTPFIPSPRVTFA